MSLISGKQKIYFIRISSCRTSSETLIFRDDVSFSHHASNWVANLRYTFRLHFSASCTLLIHWLTPQSNSACRKAYYLSNLFSQWQYKCM